jgi:hypothetical protein
MTHETARQECCPKFDPAPWDDKTFRWDKKMFVKDRVFTLFHVPLNFGQVMTRLIGKVERAGAMTPEAMCLSDHISKWTMDVYLAVGKPVDGAENVTLSGQFLSKVYEGDFKQTGTWCEAFGRFAASKGVAVKKLYTWYTTCPKCAKKYGKNYVTLVAEIGGEERA